MGKVPVTMPHLGPVVETALVVRWLKNPGDDVQAGEPLLEVETEKAVVEVEAPQAGRLIEVVVAAGETVAVGAVIATFQVVAAGTDGAEARAAREPVPASVPAPVSAPMAPALPVPPVLPVPPANPGRFRASPAARMLAAAQQVPLDALQGTGPGGRIVRRDVLAWAPATPRGASPQAAAAPGRQPLSPMRRAVARVMDLSARTVPQFTVSRQVDWTAVTDLRRRLPAGGTAPSVNDFLIWAIAGSLLAHPHLNGTFVGDPADADAYIQPADGTHIGLVVAVPDGMVVPVLHGAERIGVAAISAQRIELVDRARAGRLRKEDTEGVTCTLSNLGSEGPDRFTALLNPPASLILAVGRARELPVVAHGRVEVRRVSDLTLTVDHRLADGQSAAAFLRYLVSRLEGLDQCPE